MQGLEWLTQDAWTGMSAPEREACAQALAHDLPSGFAFAGVRSFRCGTVHREVAQYSFNGATFSLVPGAEVMLGYDDTRPWAPTEQEAEDWEKTVEDYDLRQSISEIISESTLRPHRARLGAHLIETRAEELGWRALAPEEPEAQRWIREYGRAAGVVTVSTGGAEVRLTPRDVGTLVEKAEPLTHAELTRRLATTGFRFPTPDEWEHACGAGAATLFRWGDHAPCDCDPPAGSRAERKRTPGRVPPRGPATPPDLGFAPEWDLHRRPNALGLIIAFNPYRNEATSDSAQTRGGDGGMRVCGGVGFFVAWLTLATSFFEPDAETRERNAEIMPGYTVGRRVLPLG
jgi:hypothetical protein